MTGDQSSKKQDSQQLPKPEMSSVLNGVRMHSVNECLKKTQTTERHFLPESFWSVTNTAVCRFGSWCLCLFVVVSIFLYIVYAGVTAPMWPKSPKNI